MFKATEKGNARLEEIGAELDHVSREHVLARWWPPRAQPPFGPSLDISRKRTVIKTLISGDAAFAGLGARGPFGPATVEVAWKQPDAA